MRALPFALCALGSSLACAQTVTIAPTLQNRLTWTDNVGADQTKKSDWVAEISPGLSVSRDSGRFTGLLDARLRNVGYASESQRNASFLTLQGKGEIQAVEDTLFFDLTANVSRNNQSSFSGRSGTDELSVDKNNETRAWSFGPRVEFRLGGNATGTVRYRISSMDSGGSTVGSQRLDALTARLSDPSIGQLLGWGADYEHSRTEYGSSTARNVTQESLRGTLYINAEQQLRFRVIAGHESNDYASARGESGGIYGAGFDWTPTERTTVTGTSEKRVFGNGFDLGFKHRTERSTFDLSYRKDISSSLQTLSGGIYDDPQFLAFYNDPTLVALIPEATLREAYVRTLLGYPATGGTGEVVTNAHYLSKSLRAGFSLIGVRNTFTLSLQRTDRSRLSSVDGLSAADDFALSNSVKTSSLTASFNHKLSATSSLNSTVTHSRSQGAGGTGLDTKRLTATVGLTTKLGARTTGGLSYRYQRSDAALNENDFTENAVTANLGMTF